MPTAEGSTPVAAGVGAPVAPPATLPPSTWYERVAWATVAALVLFTFVYHLVAALVAGLLTYTLLSTTAVRLRGPRLSHGAAKWIALGVLGTVAAGITLAIALFGIGFVRGHAGDLPAVFQAMAEALDAARDRLLALGVKWALLERLQSAADVQLAFSTWLREHAEALRKAGGQVGRFLVHAVMGILAGLLVFFRHGQGGVQRPLAAALVERVRRFEDAFKMVVFAQVEISAINTVLTSIYLVGILPLTGNKLPLTGTLLLITFLAGLIPVLGNLISNTVIVVLSLGVGPWVAVASLGFLVGIHKLEYLVNAKIVGARVNAAAWEVLVAILVFEVAFGVPGVVLAPVIYAYVKKELADRALV